MLPGGTPVRGLAHGGFLLFSAIEEHIFSISTIQKKGVFLLGLIIFLRY